MKQRKGEAKSSSFNVGINTSICKLVNCMMELIHILAVNDCEEDLFLSSGATKKVAHSKRFE